MSNTPNYDFKVKAILDELKPGERTCAITGEKWMMDEAEIKWYRHLNVPPSKLSPTSRWFILNGEALGFEWWWNKHPETGKPILTYVHPATGVHVLPDAEWFQKDFISAGRDVDASRSLFEQMHPLRTSVPVPATYNVKEPQGGISLLSYGDVNSYFTIACSAKNSFYSSDAFDCESVAEAYAVKNATECYRVICGARLFKMRYAYHCFDSSDCAFVFDCRNCEYIFGGTNLRNKKYVWFNEQLSREEWERRRAEVDLSRRSVVAAQDQAFQALLASQGFWPENFNENAPGCTGDYLRDVLNCQVAFASADGPRDNDWACYCYGKSERTYMTCGAVNSADSYYCATIPDSSNCNFCINLARSLNMEYCISCLNCENCFACVGLNRKKFCILNKQYSEEEYWTKLDEIKCAMLDRGEYGEFFPTSFSSSYFLESVAGINLGATKEDGIKYGFPDFDPESHGAIGELGDVTLLKDPEMIPDAIDDVKVDEWVGVALLDKQMGRRFVFLKPELEFYKAHKIAPPTRHFIHRVDSLYHTANLFLLEDTTCDQCHKTLRVAKNKTFKNRKHLCRDDYLKFLESR